MPDVIELVENANEEHKALILQLLDAVSRPLQAREIENLLRASGVPKPRAVKLANSLKHMSIIAVVGGEQ